MFSTETENEGIGQALELMKTDLKTIIEQSNELGKMAILLMDKR